MNLWQKNDFCKFCFSLKQYCITKPFPCVVLFAACLLWLSTPIVIEYTSRPPIEYNNPYTVEPTAIRAGEKLFVTRHYDVSRIAPITLTRRIEQGDCRVRCERIDLPSSEVTNTEVADNQISRRSIVIPENTSPGKWVLRVYVNWTDILGNRRSIAVPPVEFEVVK